MCSWKFCTTFVSIDKIKQNEIKWGRGYICIISMAVLRINVHNHWTRDDSQRARWTNWMPMECEIYLYATPNRTIINIIESKNFSIAWHSDDNISFMSKISGALKWTHHKNWDGVNIYLDILFYIEYVSWYGMAPNIISSVAKSNLLLTRILAYWWLHIGNWTVKYDDMIVAYVMDTYYMYIWSGCLSSSEFGWKFASLISLIFRQWAEAVDWGLFHFRLLCCSSCCLLSLTALIRWYWPF